MMVKFERETVAEVLTDMHESNVSAPHLVAPISLRGYGEYPYI